MHPSLVVLIVLASLTSATGAGVAQQVRVHLRSSPQQAANGALMQTMGGMAEMLQAQQEMMMQHGGANAEAERELAGLIYVENDLQINLESMQEENYNAKIKTAEFAVANQTSPGVADMLASMRKEMHEFGAPFYRKALQKQLTEIRARQKILMAQIDADAHTVRKQAPANAGAKTPAPQASSSWSTWWWLLAAVSVVGVVATGFFMYRRKSHDFAGASPPPPPPPPPTKTLTIKNLAAVNLKNSDLLGSSDSYVRLSLVHMQTKKRIGKAQKTAVKENGGANPKWKGVFNFGNLRNSDIDQLALKLKVLDSDSFMEFGDRELADELNDDDELGAGRVPLKNLKASGSQDLTLEIAAGYFSNSSLKLTLTLA